VNSTHFQVMLTRNKAARLLLRASHATMQQASLKRL
jgi:hypothetical protein